MNGVKLLVSQAVQSSQTYFYFAQTGAIGVGIQMPKTIALNPKSQTDLDEFVVPVKPMRSMPGIRELNSPLSD